jgi:hypothetical protein
MNPKKLKSFKQLRIELHRLRRLHDVTMYAYQQSSDYIKERLQNKEIFGDTVISMSFAGEERILARSPHEIIPKLSDTYPEVMRESLFVRAVSQFEIFLADTIREIAKRSMEPFKRQDKMLEYPQAKILSYKNIEEIQNEIVTGECRQLTSQGFNYARKYYEKRFGICFTDCPIAITEIEELHERRHLFVHRGGYIDAQYQKRFAQQMQVDERLVITDKYFQKALDNFMGLGEFIADCVDKTWPIIPQQQVKEISVVTPSKFETTILLNKVLAELWEKHATAKQTKVSNDETLAYWFKAKFKDTADMESHLNLSFTFGIGEIHTLTEIFLSSSILSESEVEWIVDGIKTVTGQYVASQKILARRGRFIEFEAKKLVGRKGEALQNNGAG